MSLFDPGPALPPEPKLSADAKRTQKRRLLLSQGVHPTTHAPLLIGVGETCGTCVHHFSHSRANTYHKCKKAKGGLAHGPNSDVRVSWPACALYEPEDA